nr:hypothetical protein [Tanacetum cinerariifolium]
NDSDESVQSGAGKDDDDDDDEDDDDDDKEERLAKDDDEDKETGKGGDMCLNTHIFDPLKKTKKRTKPDQNQTKREGYRSPEQSKAVPVKKARKNEENTT